MKNLSTANKTSSRHFPDLSLDAKELGFNRRCLDPRVDCLNEFEEALLNQNNGIIENAVRFIVQVKADPKTFNLRIGQLKVTSQLRQIFRFKKPLVDGDQCRSHLNQRANKSRAVRFETSEGRTQRAELST